MGAGNDKRHPESEGSVRRRKPCPGSSGGRSARPDTPRASSAALPSLLTSARSYGQGGKSSDTEEAKIWVTGWNRGD